MPLSMNGFIVIDKPAGLSSHDVVNRVRRIIGTRKVGHTGTLDPFATGVLPIAVNEGTKAIPFLDEGLKRYDAVMRLGVVTDTLDITGKVLCEADWATISRESFLVALDNFTGQINQMPPMYSAIKINGQPLYKLARQGREVERSTRSVEIHSLELLEFSPPLVGLRVVCSRGTYIRSLADDIGADLGCGACLQELRRTGSGPFDLGSAVSLENLEIAGQQMVLQDLIVSPQVALGHLPDIPLSADGVYKVRRGISPGWDDTDAPLPLSCQTTMMVRLSHEGSLVSIAQLNPNLLSPPKIVLKRVFA